MVALFSYAATQPEDLGFEEGDTIRVLSLGECWARGRGDMHGQITQSTTHTRTAVSGPWVQWEGFSDTPLVLADRVRATKTLVLKT